MGISDKIEAFILELLKQEQENQVRIQRNELAQIFGCVPSQINYVISTRFSPEKGYFVQSRRGGGGYITIKREEYSPTAVYIGNEISEADSKKLISLIGLDDMQSRIINAAVSQRALKTAANADEIRADILRSVCEVLGGMNL